MKKIFIILLFFALPSYGQVLFDSSMGYYTLTDTGWLIVTLFPQEDSDSYLVYNYTVIDWAGQVRQGYVKDMQPVPQLDADNRRKYMFDFVKAALKL